MPVELDDLLLVPWHEFEVLHAPEDLRSRLEHQLGLSPDEVERHLATLGSGPVALVRRAPARFGARTDRQPPSALRDLPRSPNLPEPPRAPEPAPEPEGEVWIELSLFTDDGAPIPDVELEIADDWGFAQRVTTDANGRARTTVDGDWPHALRIDTLPTLPPRPLEPQSIVGPTLPRPTDARLQLATCTPHVVVVVRPRATIVSLDGWAEGRKVLVFGQAREATEGVITVRGILRTALANRDAGGRLFVIGHADTKGAAADNDALARERATSVALYLTGDRTGWSIHAHANADMTTLKSALGWIARSCGIDCDPGDIGPGWNDDTARALAQLRDASGIPQEQPYGADDWAAIYDRYDAALAEICYCDVPTLRWAKGTLVVEIDARGEQWPAVAPQANGHDCPANRRVDLVICPNGCEPIASVDEIYDGTFVLAHLAVGAEARVRLRAITPTLASVARARLSVRIGALTASLAADQSGLVELVALCGERVQVDGCTDEFGTSHFIWGSLPQADGKAA